MQSPQALNQECRDRGEQGLRRAADRSSSHVECLDANTPRGVRRQQISDMLRSRRYLCGEWKSPMRTTSGRGGVDVEARLTRCFHCGGTDLEMREVEEL